jgi:hypothetical protein
MGQIIELNQFDANVYQYDETDLVLGGPDGTANTPLKNLANRTRYLFNNLGVIQNFEDEVILTGNAPIGNNLAKNLIVAFANGANITLTIDDPHTFKHGTIIPIVAFCTPATVVKVASAFSILNSVDGATNEMFIHHNEQLVLVAFTDHFKVAIGTRGNFFNVGEEFKGRKIIGNALALKGQLVSRASYPRLFRFVQSLTQGQEKTDEFTWNNGGLLYRGLFTEGDGVSNFRLPDERGMFERMLDLGRGVDMDRVHNFPGGYEEDQVKAHNHTDGQFSELLKADGNGTIAQVVDSDPTKQQPNITTHSTMRDFGGTETRPKNIGKINQIKF